MADSQISVVIGAQWGDEGKGKVTDFLAAEADFVVRFQGGNNAGHTICVGDKVYKLHLIPSGVISERAVSVIGCGVAVDPKVLVSELEGLKDAGIAVNLRVSERAHLIMPYHLAVDGALNSFQGDLSAGSTGRGIMAAFADKAYRHGIRVGDIIDPDLFAEKLKKAYEFNTRLIAAFGGNFSESFSSVYERYLELGRTLVPYICDTELLLHRAFKDGKRILFEGAQGMSLDPDHGLYPHGTSSNNVAGYVEVGAGVGLNMRKRIVGVVKAYTSRVGQGPVVTEIEGVLADHLRTKGAEFGTTTGRARRIGWLDLVQLKQAARVSGITEIALTKLDVLSGLDEICVATGYDVDGKIISEMPASLSMIRRAKPIYKTFPGWKDIGSAKRYEDLPKEILSYCEYLERELSCPIGIVSYGPKRNETIVRKCQVER